MRVNCLKVLKISCHLPLCPRYFSLAENALSLTLTYFDFPEILFSSKIYCSSAPQKFQSTLSLPFLWATQLSPSMPDYP